MAGWWHRLLRGIRRQEDIPDDLWRAAIARLPYAQALTTPEQSRLKILVLRFLGTKTFEGAAGFAVTDVMRVEIALQACLLILNLGIEQYAGWHSVIVYPGDFQVPKEFIDDTGVVHQWVEAVAGESWEVGPVILSWDAAKSGDERLNIVLHEFAHKLDMRDSSANGCPPLPAGISQADWARDFQAAYKKFCTALDNGLPVSFDEYAGESPAEFFAVLSEVFFLRPEAIESEFPEVYGHLRAYYRQDPAKRLRHSTPVDVRAQPLS